MASPNALHERLEFMRLGPDNQKHIRDIKDVVVKALPGALDDFYAQIQATPQTAKFFPDRALVNSAKGRQVHHWDAISSGRFDDSYVQAVTRVGEIHARIGLEPRWYIGGYALVLESLIAAVVKARWPKGGFGARKGPGADKVAAELGSLAKATLMDMDFAISVYLEAAETARIETEARVLAEERASVGRSVGEAMATLSRGDLTGEMSADLPAEYRQLSDDYNEAVVRLRETMSAIAAATDGLKQGAQEISIASDDLSRRTEQQAASLEETAAALDEITSTVRQSAQGAKDASARVADAKAQASHSGDVVGQAISAMGEIEKSSGQISQIIGVIDEIAFQTNLLALNAGVEAARAGDAGRGFAVVAQEVRALAQRSAEAAKEIKGLISASSTQVGQGVKLVGDTGQALMAIVDKVGEIDTLITAIALSSQEQASSLAQVNTAVNQMDQVVQQNAAMVEQSTAAAANLRSQSIELEQRVGWFNTGNGGRAPARTQSQPASPARPATRFADKPVQAARARLASYASGGGGGAAVAVKSDGWEEF